MNEVAKINLVLMVVFGILAIVALVAVCVGKTHQLFMAIIAIAMVYAAYTDRYFGKSEREYRREYVQRKRTLKIAQR